ncbi:transcription termination/antitermination protein NusG, partial [Streptomyces cavourensis]
MSDPNLNDSVEPEAGASKSGKDELDIVEAADSVEPDRAETAVDTEAVADETVEADEDAAVAEVAEAAEA